MKPSYFHLIALCLAYGCASVQPVEQPERLPRLIVQEPFPPMTEVLYKTRNFFDLKLQVSDNGTVLHAELASPTGDSEWDSLAQQRVRKWKFSPAIHNGKAIQMWISIRAYIQFEDPIYMELAEIVCPSSSVADSVYALLSAGEDFKQLVSLYSISLSKPFNGELGTIDIHRFGQKVQKDLLQLKENSFTNPLTLGEQFVIFKRLGKNQRFQ